MMQNKANTLPNEILIKIFEKLPKESLFACLSVCKLWFHAAGQIYYYRLCIGINKKNGNTISKLACYIEKNASLGLGYKIRNLQIDGHQQISSRIISGRVATPSPPSPKQALETLLHLCPNLQELGFSVNSIYWKHIYEMKHHTIRPTRIYTIRTQRCSEEEYFYKVAHQFRSTISQLEIQYSCDASIHDEFGSLYSYLAGFSQLKALSVEGGSQRHMIHLDRLLNTCKRLEKLCFQLDHPFFEHPLQQQPKENWLEYPSMQNLDIYLCNFEVEQLQYVIQRFTHLKKFSLRVNQSDTHQKAQWRHKEASSFEAVTQFFKRSFCRFISTLASLYLYFNIHGRSYIEDLIESFYLAHLCDVNKSPKTLVNAIFHVHHGQREQTQIELSREKKEQQRHVINYTFVRDFSEETSQNLPYISHLSLYGRCLQSLHITLTAQAKRNEAANIGFVLGLCPNLEELAIIVDLSPAVYFAFLMEYQHGSSSPRYLSCNPNTALYSKLSTLTLKGMVFTSELLNAIALHHPNLRHLSLINCLSESSNTNDTVNTLNNSSLLVYHTYDLSNLELDTLLFDVFLHRCGIKLMHPMVCIVIERSNRAHNFYLAKQEKHPDTGELFQTIDSRDYENLVSSTKLALTVLWFKVKSLVELELQVGKNQSVVKRIQLDHDDHKS